MVLLMNWIKVMYFYWLGGLPGAVGFYVGVTIMFCVLGMTVLYRCDLRKVVHEHVIGWTNLYDEMVGWLAEACVPIRVRCLVQ